MALKFVHQFATQTIDIWETYVTLSKIGWLEAEFLKVKETSQIPNVGAHTLQRFWVPSHNHPSASLLPEAKQTTEGTFHDGNRTGRPEISLDLFIDLEA